MLEMVLRKSLRTPW